MYKYEQRKVYRRSKEDERIAFVASGEELISPRERHAHHRHTSEQRIAPAGKSGGAMTEGEANDKRAEYFRTNTLGDVGGVNKRKKFIIHNSYSNIGTGERVSHVLRRATLRRG